MGHPEEDTRLAALQAEAEGHPGSTAGRATRRACSGVDVVQIDLTVMC